MAKNTFGRKVFRWAIYHKFDGLPYPGELWEDCANEKEARKILQKIQREEEQECHIPAAFHVVRSTLEALKIPRVTNGKR